MEEVGESGGSAVTATPEHNILRENCDKIVSTLTELSNPYSLAERLHSAKLIDESAMEEASTAGEASALRIGKLMSAVLAQVENNPRKFDQFVSVMGEWPETKTLLEQLQGVCVCVWGGGGGGGGGGLSECVHM